MRPSRWAAAQVESGSWVRRLFDLGQRLRAERGDDAVIDLALGQPLDEPSPAVRAAIRAAAAERGRDRFGYMPNLGYPEVRRRVAARLGLDAAGAVLTGGAGAALVLALRAFVDRGETVLGILPHFGEYPAYCATIDAGFRALPAPPGGAVDAGAVAGALDGSTRVLLLNTPCNPSGSTVTEAEMAALTAVLREHAGRTGRPVLLVLDEVYHRLVYPPATRVDAMRHYEHTVLARSFSKDLGLAGERIGYLALHPSLTTPQTERVLGVCMRSLGFVSAPATMQRMLLHLEDWDVDVAPYVARRDHAVDLARRAGLDVDPPAGALYLWARPPWDDTLGIAASLADRGVLVAPGAAFGDPTRLRICFTAPVASVERAMEEVAEVLAAGPVADADGPAEARLAG